MIKIENKIETVSYEIVEVKPGTYYFKKDLDGTITYRRYIINEKDCIACLVINEEHEKSIKSDYYYNDLPWHAESCFTGHKDVTIITGEEFDEQFVIVINHFSLYRKNP